MKSGPCLFIVFGATGDLMKRKLLPALHELAKSGALKGSHILGVGRSDMDDRAFRQYADEALESPSAEWCEQCLHFRRLADSEEPSFRQLGAEIEAIERNHGLPGNRVFYLALPPEAFAPTIAGIGNAGIHRCSGWTRIVVEKPFGQDVDSARDLNAILHSHFSESEIYRIDHYLGKETVQNLLVFRFANPIFESLWNRDRIQKVEITVAEELGVEKRAGYYDRTGALRDMLQNHLTQVLSLIAMEVPASMEAEPVRDEKVKVLRSIAAVRREDVVRGQYRGYREEPGVRSTSTTETFVEVHLDIANWRWNGVPFVLRTGKRLARRTSEIVITFHRAPVSVFRPFECCDDVRSNVLIITIQPEEGFQLKFHVKTPGQPVQIAMQELEFRYAEAFSSIPEGYQTLLQDVLDGDQSLFVRSDWIEESWKLYDAILKSPPPIKTYEPGTWGPDE